MLSAGSGKEGKLPDQDHIKGLRLLPGRGEHAHEGGALFRRAAADALIGKNKFGGRTISWLSGIPKHFQWLSGRTQLVLLDPYIGCPCAPSRPSPGPVYARLLLPRLKRG